MSKIAVAIGLALTLAACGSAPSDTNGGTIDTGHGTLTVTKAPDNLPPYAQVYPGAAISDGVVSKPTEGQGGGVMTMTTPDAAAKVMAFYDRAAASAGLKKGYAEPAADDGVWMATFSDASAARPSDDPTGAGKRRAVRSFNVTTEPAESGAGTKISVMYQ